MNGSVSLKSIAEKCGLSVSAVSQILNKRSGNYCSAATKQRVIDTAKQLGYQRNFVYQLMHGQKTGTFAIILSQPHMQYEEFTRELIVDLMNELCNRNYAAYFSIQKMDPECNLKNIINLLERGVEYFIFLGTPCGFREIEQRILQAGKALVGTSNFFRRYVAVDSLAGVVEIYRYFQKCVGENFRVIGNPADNYRGDIRFMALQQVFPNYSTRELLARFWRQIPIVIKNVADYNQLLQQNGYLVMAQIIRETPEVGAVFCHVDTSALGAAACLVDQQIAIGRDIRLAGFNNDFAVRTYPFPISSVSHAWHDRFGMLIDAALSPGECQVTLPPRTFIREVTTLSEKDK